VEPSAPPIPAKASLFLMIDALFGTMFNLDPLVSQASPGNGLPRPPLRKTHRVSPFFITKIGKGVLLVRKRLAARGQWGQWLGGSGSWGALLYVLFFFLLGLFTEISLPLFALHRIPQTQGPTAKGGLNIRHCRCSHRPMAWEVVEQAATVS